ncbi:MAG: FAD-dependent oxidoreductase [Mariniphaga sp.]|nr:FAD-dependent oxidoreductase [Mariniphaga sp.]
MTNNSRRRFINRIVGGSLGMSAFPSLAFAGRKDRSYAVQLKNLPVIDEVDICVLGGSCTGVFAAIRASRLRAKVAIIEKQNAFGGVATHALVNIWHSIYDAEFKQQIIAGLTTETMERLARRNAVVKTSNNHSKAFTFNSQELKIELDEMVLESNIHPYLHTLFSEPFFDEDKRLTGIIVDNKSGRGIIKAKYFIDATGDGDLCQRLGLDTYAHDLIQPPTTCAHFEGLNIEKVNNLLKEHREEFNIPDGFLWGSDLPGTNTFMMAGTRVYGVNCSVADDLTRAEMEGRRQIRAIMDMVRKYAPQEQPGLVALPSSIGIRETRHVRCRYQVTDHDALDGKRFEDAIANGSYRLDIHHQDKPGLTFMYLDGTQVYSRPGYPNVTSRWREDAGENTGFYQVPLRSLIPPKYNNLMIAGRMLDAQMIAFSGIRVMVNMNQLGEAAGVTSSLALHKNKAIHEVDSKDVRNELKKGGSIIV